MLTLLAFFIITLVVFQNCVGASNIRMLNFFEDKNFNIFQKTLQNSSTFPSFI